MNRLVIVNPNSTEAVTHGIREAVARVPGAKRLTIDYLTLADGPPGIETDADIEAVVPPLQALVQAREDEADGFVIACFSDPGVAQLRCYSSKPVYGIGECGYFNAAARGRRFGVISIRAESVPRHRRHIAGLGLAEQLAGDRPLDLPVTALPDAARTLHRLREVAHALVEQDGAQALLLGCAGMAAYRETLQTECGCSVVDPCQAALLAVLGTFPVRQ